MANFELCIYVIPEENIDEVIEKYEVHDTSDLTNEQFIEACEGLGTVHTLKGFLNLGIIAPCKDVIRAFFINRDNPEAEPVKADGYETVITVSKITNTVPIKNGNSLEYNNVLFEEV